MQDCPRKHEFDSLWRRIEAQDGRISSNMAALSALTAHMDAAEKRHRDLVAMISEDRGARGAEFRVMQKSIDALCISDARRTETAAERARLWKWGLSMAGVVIAALALTGRSDAEPAIITGNQEALEIKSTEIIKGQ